MGRELIRINVTLGDNGKVTNGLVFDIQDIKRLRSIGVCGVLSGSLPTIAQQNVFLSIPLRLMAEETIWLVSNGHAVLNVTRPKTLEEKLSDKRLAAHVCEESKVRMKKSFEAQRAFKKEQHVKKLQELGIATTRAGDDGQLLESSLFYETMNDSQILTDGDRLAITNLFPHNRDYPVYEFLRDRDFVVSPGARFGGKYIVYPGDPLRFHSHMVVSPALDYKKDVIEFRDIINGSRLSTTVKKIWVVPGIEDKQIHLFSIEWAGFG